MVNEEGTVAAAATGAHVKRRVVVVVVAGAAAGAGAGAGAGAAAAAAAGGGGGGGGGSADYRSICGLEGDPPKITRWCFDSNSFKHFFSPKISEDSHVFKWVFHHNHVIKIF